MSSKVGKISRSVYVGRALNGMISRSEGSFFSDAGYCGAFVKTGDHAVPIKECPIDDTIAAKCDFVAIYNTKLGCAFRAFETRECAEVWLGYTGSASCGRVLQYVPASEMLASHTLKMDTFARFIACDYTALRCNYRMILNMLYDNHVRVECASLISAMSPTNKYALLEWLEGLRKDSTVSDTFVNAFLNAFTDAITVTAETHKYLIDGTIRSLRENARSSSGGTSARDAVRMFFGVLFFFAEILDDGDD